MTTTQYVVTGMSCGHCVNAVTDELSQVSGVSDVAVDLPSGQVTVTSDGPISDDDVRVAIDEAGYELAAR